jgi:putative membrane protein
MPRGCVRLLRGRLRTITSMHMTLLGALIALSPRTLFAHQNAEALSDQHLGGALMLLLGGASYLTGGLALSVRFVRAEFAE